MRTILLVALAATFLLPLDTTAQEDLFAGGEQTVTARRAKLLSALYPGLGHLVAGHRQKGTSLVTATTASLVIWLSSHADYNTHEEQFDLEAIRYAGLRDNGSFADADDSWRRLQDRKDDLDRSHNLRMLFGVAAVGLYSYNLIDAFLLGGVEPRDPGRVAVQPHTIDGRPGLALIARFD